MTGANKIGFYSARQGKSKIKENILKQGE